MFESDKLIVDKKKNYFCENWNIRGMKKVPGATIKSGRGSSERKKNTKKKEPTYATYVYRILKEIDPERGISTDAIAIMDHFAKDIFDRCAVEAARLTKLNSKRTMTAKEVRTAVRLLLPDELSCNAIRQGNNALEMYNESSNRFAQ